MDPRYFPKVLQAFPTDDFKVYVYFDDGSIKLFDAAPLLKLGEFRNWQTLRFSNLPSPS